MRANSTGFIIDIMMGLPGSGKTTLAKDMDKNYKVGVIYVDEEKERIKKYYGTSYGNRTTEQIITDQVKKIASRVQSDRIVVDGLFLTNDDIIKAVNCVLDGVSASYYGTTSDKKLDVYINIHQFEEDREKCLKNDGGRRDTPSATTILNAKYEKANTEQIRTGIVTTYPINSCSMPVSKHLTFNIYQIKVLNKDIILKSNWETFFKPRNVKIEDGKLHSETWIAGGEYGNCWDDSKCAITPDEPVNFDALDNLLMEICPNLTFLQYKKITAECVETETDREGTYYGGYEEIMYYVCDLKRLYELLVEFGYIKEE